MAITVQQFITLPENVVIINDISDFPEPVLIGSDYIITLEENVVYEFGTGQFDLGVNQFVITNGVKIRGQGLTKTILTTSLTSGTIFTCAGNNSSAVEIEHLQLLCPDTNVRLFDISNVQRVYLTSAFFFHLGDLGQFNTVDTLRTDSTTALVGFSAGNLLHKPNAGVSTNVLLTASNTGVSQSKHAIHYAFAGSVYWS